MNSTHHELFRIIKIIFLFFFTWFLHSVLQYFANIDILFQPSSDIKIGISTSTYRQTFADFSAWRTLGRRRGFYVSSRQCNRIYLLRYFVVPLYRSRAVCRVTESRYSEAVLPPLFNNTPSGAVWSSCDSGIIKELVLSRWSSVPCPRC